MKLKRLLSIVLSVCLLLVSVIIPGTGILSFAAAADGNLLSNGNFANGLVGYRCWSTTTNNYKDWSNVRVTTPALAEDTIPMTGGKDGYVAYLPGRTSAADTIAASGNERNGKSNLITTLTLEEGFYRLSFDAFMTKAASKTQWNIIASTGDVSIHERLTDKFSKANGNDLAEKLNISVINKKTGKEVALKGSTYKYVEMPAGGTEDIYAEVVVTFALSATDKKKVNIEFGCDLAATTPGHAYVDNFVLEKQAEGELFVNGKFNSEDLRGYTSFNPETGVKETWTDVDVVNGAVGEDDISLTGPMAYLPGRSNSATAGAGRSTLTQKITGLTKGYSYKLTLDADFTKHGNAGASNATAWLIDVFDDYDTKYHRCTGKTAISSSVVAKDRTTGGDVELTYSATNKQHSLKASAAETIKVTVTILFTVTKDGPVYFEIGNDVAKTAHGHAYVDNISLVPTEIPKSKVTFDDLVNGTPDIVIEQAEGSTFELPKPENREGYKFVGWYSDKDTLKNPATDKVPVDDITYYAKWTPFRAGNWEGDQTKPAKGDGNKETPFEITNANELAWAVHQYGSKSAGKYFKLMDDIIINDYTGDDWYNYTNDWHISPWSGSGNKDFQGTFDGNGKVIHGLCVNTSDSANEIGGLFLTLGPNAVIKNLGIENSYVKAYKFAGTFVAATKNSSSTMTSATAPQFIACYVGENTYVETVVKGGWDIGFAGGFVGWAAFPVTFRYCYSKAEVKTATVGESIGYGGAFVGGSNQMTDIITYRSCYSVPADENYNMQGYSKSGGAKGNNSYATANKNGNTVIVKGVELVNRLSMIGDEAKTYMPNLDYDKIWKITAGKTPELRIFTDPDAIDPVTHIDPFEMRVVDDAQPGDIWSGGTATKFKEGKGTPDEPYLISTAEELVYFHSLLTDSSYNNWKTTDKYYRITHDIYLNDVSNPKWYESGKAKSWLTGTAQNQGINGHLDGDGHVIYGLFFDADEELVGLFPSIIKDGSVTGLGIASSYIFNRGSAAAMFAYVYNSSGHTVLPTISECFIAEDVYIGSSEGSIGGFAAQAPSAIKIENCVFLGQLEGAADASGGLLGYSWLGDPKYPKYYEGTQNHIMQEIYTSLVADDGRSQAIAYKGYDEFETGTNVYTRGASRAGISTQVPMSKMTGENARTYLAGFDFENVWQIVDKGTPALKAFADKGVSIDLLSKALVPTVVTFETYGGTALKALKGYAGTKLKLPTPKRNVDLFGGWYVYPHKTWDVKFDYDVFPDDDITLYAKWITNSIEQNFEEYPFLNADEYGLEADFEIHRLGSIDFNSEYIHSGARSLRRLGFIEGYKNATLNNEIKLIKGAKYNASMWVYVKEAPTGADELKIAYLQNNDWAYDELATETVCRLNSLKKGQWNKVTFSFVAYSEYLGLSIPQCDVFIDDFEAIYTAKTGLRSNAVISKPKYETTIIPAEIDTMEENADTTTSYKVIKKRRRVNNSLNWWIYVVIAAGAIAVLGGTAVAIILIRKKKKQAKV